MNLQILFRGREKVEILFGNIEKNGNYVYIGLCTNPWYKYAVKST